MKKPTALSLATQYASQRPCPDRSQLRRWAAATLQSASVARAHLVIRFVDRAEGRGLNRTFRGRDYPTNVLTFPYEEHAGVRADIVLCAPVIEQEARVQRKRPRDHYAHLVVHGMLHALGYLHDSRDDAAQMEALETTILARFGIANPYD